MTDYEPVDISRWCNSGAEVMPEERLPGPTSSSDGGRSRPRRSLELPLGRQRLRGLPFLVGTAADTDAARCLITLDGAAAPVTIGLGAKARRVIIAHRLLETELPDGGPLGVPVADYVFRLEGGREVPVPIRERFEIAAGQSLGPIPGVPGEPFLAVTDVDHSLAPRHEGSWNEMAGRQMEVVQGRLRHFYLWAWANPEPDLAVESLTIVPKGPRFVVAAVTLGQLEEHPFAGSVPGRRDWY